jgi:mannose-6-phosphate isomerase-like protein (cupin superfamily)
MAPSTYFTHINDVTPENMDSGEGWLITEFRLSFSDRQGLGTTMFHAQFNPGAVHKKHKHENCEEIYYIVSGQGIAGAGGATEEIEAGHFHYVPADTEHWLANESEDEPIIAVGWYLGAGNVAATGYVYMGDVTEADLQGPHKGYDVGSLVNVADVAPSDMSGIESWGGTEFRACLGEAQGIGHSAWQPVLTDGQALKAHRHNNADEYYLVVAGTGRAGVGDEFADLSVGTCVHVPAGTAHWFAANSADTLVTIGLHEGANSLEAGGFESLGDIPVVAE